MYDALLQLLQASSVTHNPHITDLKVYGPNAFRVKMRAMVTPTLTFQVWLNHNPRYTRYAYQLFSHGNALLRWDNALIIHISKRTFCIISTVTRDEPFLLSCKAIHCGTCQLCWQRSSNSSRQHPLLSERQNANSQA